MSPIVQHLRPRHQLPDPPLAEVQVAEEERLLHLWGEIAQVRQPCSWYNLNLKVATTVGPLAQARDSLQSAHSVKSRSVWEANPSRTMPPRRYKTVIVSLAATSIVVLVAAVILLLSQ